MMEEFIMQNNNAKDVAETKRIHGVEQRVREGAKHLRPFTSEDIDVEEDRCGGEESFESAAAD
ncbi:MAG: hypothetical protein IKP20_01780 [Candidatus Methanomethylophilaceae archaeon]|nr:hypothetical protein [Candidatus Methanomethylophilaceae archaeon]